MPKNKEELIDLLHDTKMHSVIDSETLTMLEGVIQLSEMRVRDIMLPKNQMVTISEHDNLEQVIETVTKTGHSRFPVISDNQDEIKGILHAKDLLRFHNSIETFDLRDIVRLATVVPGSRRLDLLLSEFRANKNHMALVVDEYGVVIGFVTIEDIIEQIIGDIEDEFDIDEETYIKAHGNAQYIVKSYTPIEEFNKEMNANLLDTNYDTIGGIIIAEFGYLPKRGEIISIEQFEFKIISANARRIKLLSCIDKRQNQARKISNPTV